MRKLLLFSVLFATVCALGCGMAEGPRQKFQHAVFKFNEGLRWGYQSDVLPRVDAETRANFAEMHEGWGEIVQVSNAEVRESVYDEKTRKATVIVRFTWYRKDQMVVNTTETKQYWESVDNVWMMMAEEFVSGTPF